MLSLLCPSDAAEPGFESNPNQKGCLWAKTPDAKHNPVCDYF